MVSRVCALTNTTGLFRRVGHLARTVWSALGLLVDALPVLGKCARKTQPDTLGGHLLQALGHKIEHTHLVWTSRTCSCWPLSPPPAVFADSALGSEHSRAAHRVCLFFLRVPAHWRLLQEAFPDHLALLGSPPLAWPLARLSLMRP